VDAVTTGSAQPSPEVSVVIAAIDGRSDVEASIGAVKQQARHPMIEILLVANHDHPCAAARRSDNVTVVISERRRLVPELWGLGFAQARGSIVAVTIAGCIPQPRWIDAIVRAHQSPDAGVGGAIEQHVPGAIVDWAVYFVRYAAYMQPMAAGPALQVPGDNGSYKRAALEDERAAIAARGFWEYEINTRLVARGRRLSLAPDMLVRHTHSFGIRGFCRQRWQHGRIFGRRKAAGMSGPTRLARTLMAPVSLALMVVRAATQVFSRRRHRLAFLRALPLVVVFHACWIAGETAGLSAGGE
jgi:hypothetical protein